MDIVISNSDPRPIYEQITAQIKSQILSGLLHAGDLLPSMRLLARQLHISVITTRRAYSDLEAEGFLETVAGKGCFVAQKDMKLVRAEQSRRVEELLGRAAELARQSGISLGELHGVLDRLYGGND
ncbi:GntR family transcriptional regulator [Caproicibacter sp.]|uniref:GntR family transcriptional regulator n=1 Tax=Caproicibacter sp. TaxID=2814884 RepID=UPI00398947A6